MPATSTLLELSTVLLLAYAALSAVDGLYVHLWRLRLHARPASWGEHLWHTARAVLFAPLVLIVFAAPTAGVVLWTGLALVLLDTAVEVLDVRAERTSRADLGGVGRGELALHVVLAAARAGAVVLAFAARPLGAWSPAAPMTLGAHPPWVEAAALLLVPGALAAAALHLALAWRHRPAACGAAVAA